MLTVYLGKDYLYVNGKISNVSAYFDEMYEPEWFSSDFAKRVANSIDNVEYFGSGDVFISDKYGAMPAKELSSGTKALLILANEENVLVSGDRMGDNCVPFLLELAEKKDIKITLCHLMQFPEQFEFYCIPQNKVITTSEDFLRAWLEVRPVEGVGVENLTSNGWVQG